MDIRSNSNGALHLGWQVVPARLRGGTLIAIMEQWAMLVELVDLTGGKILGMSNYIYRGLFLQEFSAEVNCSNEVEIV